MCYKTVWIDGVSTGNERGAGERERERARGFKQTQNKLVVDMTEMFMEYNFLLK